MAATGRLADSPRRYETDERYDEGVRWDILRLMLNHGKNSPFFKKLLTFTVKVAKLANNYFYYAG